MIENNFLFINKVKIKNIIQLFDLPIYIYDYKKILFNIYVIYKIDFYFFYSVKSNDNLFILKIINKTIKKFDIVSIGELEKIILISKKKPKIIFSGCGKNLSELIISINYNIFSINIESLQELLKINFISYYFKNKIKIMIRINPNLNSLTHKKISTGNINNKFGIIISHINQFFILSKLTKSKIIGYSFHIGSQILKIKPFILLLFTALKILKIKRLNFLDLGGGIGVDYYNKNKILNFIIFYKKIKNIIKEKKISVKFIVEFGRLLLCNTCILLSKINYMKFNKGKIISIANFGMNDIIRPALYNSYHKIESENFGKKVNKVFGPICESSDEFIENKFIKIKINSILIIFSCGSYCKVMSCNYNSKKKIFEILIYKNKIKIIYTKQKNFHLIENYE